MKPLRASMVASPEEEKPVLLVLPVLPPLGDAAGALLLPLPEACLPWRRVAGVVLDAAARFASMEAVARMANSGLARNTPIAAVRLEGSMSVPN